MDKPQNERTVLFLVIIVATLGIVIGHILSWKLPTFNDNTDNLSAVVTVENTLMVNGILPVPQGFPEDIPLESGEIVESATTYYPDQNAKQLSVSYRSAKTMVEKYAEYKDYMNQADYSLTEKDGSSGTKTLSGTKGDNSFSVTIRNADGKTLVELSYLSK
jgi:hypothetical protein